MSTLITSNKSHAGDEDHTILLTIFPAEIWQLIANSVHDPEDLYKMAKASSFLEMLLEPHKDMYLFYLVLKIRDRHSNSLLGFDSRLTNLCYLLGTGELLQCRLVCSGWKNAVNKFLEARPHHSAISTINTVMPLAMHEFKDPAPMAYFRLQKFTRVAGSDALLLSELSAPSSSIYKLDPLSNCPSPTRHLEIVQERFNQEQLKTALIRSLLNMYRQGRGAGGDGGRPLYPVPLRSPIAEFHKFAKIFLEEVGPTFHHLTIKVASCRMVLECVERMPNLRSLHILPWDCGWNEGVVSVSFPGLKNLNRITLVGMPEPISRAIFEANPWAKVVAIFRPRHHRRGTRPELEAGKPGMPWPANPTGFSTTIMLDDELAEMPVTWKLNALKLNFLDEKFIRWSSIFRKLECYQGTLTELYLKLPKYEKGAASAETIANCWEASKTQLNLPKVKMLEVKVENICSLDFLLGMTSLEHLSLHLEYKMEDGITQEDFSRIMMDRVDYHRGFSERFMECNIWELMGNLNVVELRKGKLTMRKYKRMTA